MTRGALQPGRSPARLHYAFVVLVLVFMSLLAAAGLRAAPGVLILPLELSFGWDRTTVSAGAGVGILVNGLVGPFAAALMQAYGIKRVLLAGLALMGSSTFASLFMTEPWQYLLTWGLVSGIGSGAVAGVLAAAVVNRWFARRQGLVMGVLTASTATGSLIFLPAMAKLSEAGDWRPVVWTVTIVMAALIPLVWLFVRERPENLRLGRYGEAPGAEPPSPSHVGRNFVAVRVLRSAWRDSAFWLLFGGFFVCGLTTNGLVGTHLIAFCGDHGIAPVVAASWLAFMGIFDIVGATASGWLSDRYDPRKLLFAYFGLRGLSLLALPFLDLGGLSVILFLIFFGLDWIATVPPTLKLLNAHFGESDGPIIYGWIFTGHQAGAATAAIGAGVIRHLSGDYASAFLLGGILALLVALIFILWRRPAPISLPAAA
ncbi:MFS transporter [Sphingomonas sp.]|uniref:MFS transporter n=1 Tax=Sphingomonas sp. TaxID=28214 RepID=UPI002E111CE0